jgi:ABC-type amino acid transport substrate-binding protein
MPYFSPLHRPSRTPIALGSNPVTLSIKLRYFYYLLSTIFWKKLMNQKNQLLFGIAITLGIVIALGTVYKKKNGTSAPAGASSTLVVGTNAEYPPFTYNEKGVVVGFDIDVVKEIARRLGKEIVLQDMPFDALMPQMQLGSIQVIAAGLTPTPERAKQVFFTQPHFSGDPLVIISKNTDNNGSRENNKSGEILDTVEKLRDKRVVVNEGFTADYYISQQNIPDITRLGTLNEGVLALQSNRADAFVTAQSAIKPFLATVDGASFQVSLIPGTEDNAALAVSKKHPHLFEEIKRALASMEEDGTLGAIKSRWNL